MSSSGEIGALANVSIREMVSINNGFITSVESRWGEIGNLHFLLLKFENDFSLLFQNESGNDDKILFLGNVFTSQQYAIFLSRKRMSARLSAGHVRSVTKCLSIENKSPLTR